MEIEWISLYSSVQKSLAYSWRNILWQGMAESATFSMATKDEVALDLGFPTTIDLTNGYEPGPVRRNSRYDRFRDCRTWMATMHRSAPDAIGVSGLKYVLHPSVNRYRRYVTEKRSKTFCSGDSYYCCDDKQKINLTPTPILTLKLTLTLIRSDQQKAKMFCKIRPHKWFVTNRYQLS